MFAQLVYFDRPRSAEELSAEDFADEHRILPSVADLLPALAGYRMRRDDGSEIVVVIAQDRAVLEDAQQRILGSALLPDENPDLLAGADRAEIVSVHGVFGGRNDFV